MAKASAAAPPAKRSWLWLQGALCGGVAVTAPGTAALLATLMLLGIGMVFIEDTPGRPSARAMLLMGAASTFQPLRHLWEQGGSLDAAFDILSNPVVPLWSWTASGSAWLIAQLWEVLAHQIMRASDDRAARKLKDERAAIEKEWNDVL